jgi:hypothetical protein
VKWNYLLEEQKDGEESHLNTGKTAAQAEKKIPAVPASHSTSWRDEEELVDYELESPPSFSPAIEDFSELEDRLRTPVPEQADDSASDEGFRKITSGGSKSAIDKDKSAAPPRKGGKSVISAEADESVANLPRITSGGSKSAIDKDESAAPPRKGGKSVIPAKRDDGLATLPISTLEGSNPTDPDGGRFVAIRGTGSNAPGFTDEHNPRPSRLCVDEVPVGNNFPYKESISQEYQASDGVDKAPQQRAGPFPLETPRISKSGGLRADPSPPYEPISTRKVQQHDVALYALPGKPNRQLSKLDLGACDFQLLNEIESVANSLPYLGNEVFRNDLILDSELRTSTVCPPGSNTHL